MLNHEWHAQQIEAQTALLMEIRDFLKAMQKPIINKEKKQSIDLPDIILTPARNAPEFGFGRWESRGGMRVHIDTQQESITKRRHDIILGGTIEGEIGFLSNRFHWDIRGKCLGSGNIVNESDKQYDLIKLWEQKS